MAAIPEGLPAIVTIALAIGVRRMAHRNAIVRRLPSVETLGAVTVICTDKTGTLTRNEMTARRAVTFDGEYEFTGLGYGPEGEVRHQEAVVDVFAHPALAALARAAVLCNDAAVLRTGIGWRLEGDPTEGALVALAMKSGLDVEAERARAERIDAIPFESERRWMATLHRQSEGDAMIVVKGAPEAVLAMCATQLTAGRRIAFEAGYWAMCLDGLTDGGMRVLAIAAKWARRERCTSTPEDVTGDLSLIGLIGLIDPPREEAIAAIASCRAAGIRVKMITGDHALTARAIARDLGLGGGRTLTGADLDRIEPADFVAAIEGADVFARTSPEHKLMLVAAMQRAGDVVAMTGDGVNDAPALKRADVGVAMGRKGTEAAKEAAAIVLADDNFASIAHAVEEGRTVYENIRKAILYMLPTNGAEAAVLVVAIVFGFAIPITPVQILWVNMVTETLLSMVIAFEPTGQGIMVRPPRPPDGAVAVPLSGLAHAARDGTARRRRDLAAPVRAGARHVRGSGARRRGQRAGHGGDLLPLQHASHGPLVVPARRARRQPLRVACRGHVACCCRSASRTCRRCRSCSAPQRWMRRRGCCACSWARRCSSWSRSRRPGSRNRGGRTP